MSLHLSAQLKYTWCMIFPMVYPLVKCSELEINVIFIPFVLCLRFIAVTHGKQIKVWHAPDYSKEFAPFTVHRTYTGLFDDTVCIDWSADSR